MLLTHEMHWVAFQLVAIPQLDLHTRVVVGQSGVGEGADMCFALSLWASYT